MNEEGKELTVDFLMQQLEIENCNAHHKSLSQLGSRFQTEQRQEQQKEPR